MTGTIRISARELTNDLVEKLKALLDQNGLDEITISFGQVNNKQPRQETSQQYWQRLEQSAWEIANGEGQAFTIEQLEALIKK